MQEQIDLQATQYVINLFESSKSNSEEALENLPGVYAVIDFQGQILKCNRGLARLFAMNHEALLGFNLSKLFSEKNWQIFKTYLTNIENQSAQNTEFEIDSIAKDGSVQNFLWQITPLRIKRENINILFSVVGRDVTDLHRATEQSTRMQMELNTAKVVQDTFSPPSTTVFGNFTIAGHSESATECGGDWRHYSMMNDKLFLWMGDVTGHGVPAALVVSAAHSVASTISNSEITPSGALSLLSRAVRAASGGQRAMTMFIASIDPKTYECVYASAAHEPAFLFSHEQNNITMRDLRLLQAEVSQPLGTGKVENYKEYKIQLSPGDRLFFYTDGLYDVSDPAGKSWGRSNFYRNIASLASKYRNPQDLVSELCKTMKTYRQGSGLLDDATFFVCAM